MSSVAAVCLTESSSVLWRRPPVTHLLSLCAASTAAHAKSLSPFAKASPRLKSSFSYIKANLGCIMMQNLLSSEGSRNHSSPSLIAIHPPLMTFCHHGPRTEVKGTLFISRDAVKILRPFRVRFSQDHFLIFPSYFPGSFILLTSSFILLTFPFFFLPHF